MSMAVNWLLMIEEEDRMVVETLDKAKLSDVKLRIALPDGTSISCTARTLDMLEELVKLYKWETSQGELVVEIELADATVLRSTYVIDVSDDPIRFSYGDFIEWVSGELEQRQRLADLDLNRYAEVHVSYAHLYYYLTLRRDASVSLRNLREKSISFHKISFASRLRLIEQLSYSWTFSFEDSDWGHHYYYGPLDRIHASLLNVALNRERIEDVDQMVAFEGLIHLYRLAPDVMLYVNLSDIMFFTTMTLPGYYEHLAPYARAILDLLKTRHELHVSDAYTKLADKVQVWFTSYLDSIVIAENKVVDPTPAPDLYLQDTAVLNKPRVLVTPIMSVQDKLKIAANSKPKPFG